MYYKNYEISSFGTIFITQFYIDSWLALGTIIEGETPVAHLYRESENRLI